MSDLQSNNLQFINDTYTWKNTTLYEYLEEGNYPSEWNEFFQREDIQAELKDISRKINSYNEQVIYPPINQVFRAFYSIPPHKIKLVILGQDCYHNGSAVGLCFSVKPGNRINPSLINMYTEMKNCGYDPKKNGVLTHLPSQGVFLINGALTVMKGKADSHTHIWKAFTEKVVQFVNEQSKNALWLLMGARAISFSKYLNEENIFGTSHPSPYSAYKNYKEYPSFIGSGVFREINEKINPPIEW